MRATHSKAFIHKKFEEMICEIDFEQITVKELIERAMKNLKTFYLHYDSLDDLLLEMKNEIAQGFIKRTQDLKRPNDIDKMFKDFHPALVLLVARSVIFRAIHVHLVERYLTSEK